MHTLLTELIELNFKSRNNPTDYELTLTKENMKIVHELFRFNNLNITITNPENNPYLDQTMEEVLLEDIKNLEEELKEAQEWNKALEYDNQMIEKYNKKILKLMKKRDDLIKEVKEVPTIKETNKVNFRDSWENQIESEASIVESGINYSGGENWTKEIQGTKREEYFLSMVVKQRNLDKNKPVVVYIPKDVVEIVKKNTNLINYVKENTTTQVNRPVDGLSYNELLKYQINW